HFYGFPMISRIMRDVLAVSDAISPVERLFSKLRHVCTDPWFFLAAATVTQFMYTKPWIR
ncbi:hypothetical protein EV424DRAFT_1316485, partial [Suillus variegatus]